jgi:hypothetical protein
MDDMPQYYGVYEQIIKLQKLPKDETLKVTDVLTLLEMIFEVLEKQHIRIKKLEDISKKN